MNQVYRKYYLPYKQAEETQKDLLVRVDKKIIEDRFNYIMNRDILTYEVLNVSSCVD